MHKRITLLLLFFLLSFACHAQWPFKKDKEEKDKKEKLKLYQNSRGVLIGYGRGRADVLQLGYHFNWKKIRLQKPVIHATEAYLEVAPFNGVVGAKVAYWQRQGRLKFTYGLHGGFFTNFKESTFSLGPSIGFRLLGFHGQLGYNILSNKAVDANRLYVSVSAMIPIHTKLSSKRGNKEKTILKW